MATIPLRELRNDYAGVLRRVEEGESFTVTRDGRPVASLTPWVPPTGVGPQTWVPAEQVTSSLAHLGPGLGEELRRSLDTALDVYADDPFDREHPSRGTPEDDGVPGEAGSGGQRR